MSNSKKRNFNQLIAEDNDDINTFYPHPKRRKSETEIINSHNLASILKHKQKQWINFLSSCLNNDLLSEITIILSEYYQPPFTLDIKPDQYDPNSDFNGSDDILDGYTIPSFTNIDVDYTIFSTGYEMRILSLMNDKKEFPNCVYLKGCTFHGVAKEEFSDWVDLKYNDKGEYMLNEDNGNTQFLLSIIDAPLGVIFKGMAPLQQLMDIQYCHRWALTDCQYTQHDGLKILSVIYDAESG
eukprot:455442_1